MPRTVQIDLSKAVKHHTQQDFEFRDTIEISKETNLHRFGEEDEVHLLTDGCGGYQLILHPDTPDAQIWRGHLSDFSEEI